MGTPGQHSESHLRVAGMNLSCTQHAVRTAGQAAPRHHKQDGGATDSLLALVYSFAETPAAVICTKRTSRNLRKLNHELNHDQLDPTAVILSQLVAIRSH